MNFIKSYLMNNFEEVSPMEFYREIFPKGELQEIGVYKRGKYNAIAIEFFSPSKINRYTITDDQGAIEYLIKSEKFVIIAPVSYAGKARTSENARYLYALAFDLDGIGNEGNLKDLFYQFETGHQARPTFIVQSGNDGLHLYYQLEEPIPLFKNVKEQLSRLKRGLTTRIWNQFVTTLSSKVQYQSALQGFRMVGTRTKQGGITRAYRVGEKVTIEYLNSFVKDEDRLIEYSYKSNLPLTEAKEKYPEWYKKRIVKGEKKGRWTTNRALYDWWLNRMNEVEEGHRYHAIACLAIYAKKSGISREELKKDAYGLIDMFEEETIREDNHFTREDVKAALKMYDEDYATYPIDEIERVSGLRIDRNKRNYRKQEIHLRLARGQLAILRELGEVEEGRPKGSGTKEKRVKEYLKNNPESTPTEVARAVNVSRPTVYKYKKEMEENK